MSRKLHLAMPEIKTIACHNEKAARQRVNAISHSKTSFAGKVACPAKNRLPKNTFLAFPPKRVLTSVGTISSAFFLKTNIPANVCFSSAIKNSAFTSNGGKLFMVWLVKIKNKTFFSVSQLVATQYAIK